MNIKETTVALAGITQAATLAHQFATTGKYDEEAFECSIHSIYFIDAPDTLSIYGDLKNLRLGFRSLSSLLSRTEHKDDKILSRYILSLIQAQRLLMNDKKLLNALRKKLLYAVSQADFFSKTHPTVVKSLGQIYSETVSTLPSRIHIIGQRTILQNNDNMNVIRALLLAGVRSAVLWQQLGGNKWQLLFQRKKIAAMSEELVR